MGLTPDRLRVRFNDPLLFLGLNGKLIDEETRIIEKNMKRQIGVDWGEIFDESITAATVVTQTVMISNMILNIFLVGAMNQMWVMIETQQLIILLLMCNIVAPANAMMFFSRILEIAAFDFFDVEPWTNYLLKLEPTGALNDKFEDLGMESLYFFNNLGSWGIFFAIYMTCVLALPCLRRDCCKNRSLIKHNRKKIKEALVWTWLISSVKESGSIIAICVFINFKTMHWHGAGDTVHNTIAIGFFGLIFVFPLYSIWLIYKNYQQRQLEGDRFKRKFGLWYADLDIKKGANVLLWPTFYIMRRLQLAAVVVFIDMFIFQTFGVIFQLLWSIIFVGYYRPWKDTN